MHAVSIKDITRAWRSVCVSIDNVSCLVLNDVPVAQAGAARCDQPH